MAGRARTNAILDAIESRRASHFDGDTEPTSLDFLSEWVASGRTVKALAEELTRELGWDIWAETLLRIFRRQYSETGVATALREARVRASHHLADESLAIVDAADETSSSAVAKANSQARSRQWLAERFSPEAFGTKSGNSVTINMAALHLDALRALAADPNKVTSTSAAPVLVVAQPSQPSEGTAVK